MKRVYFSVIAAFFSAMAIAQDNAGSSSTTVNVTKSSTSFPWLWVVIGVVFLIVLIALLSGGGSSSNTVVEKKTIIKD